MEESKISLTNDVKEMQKQGLQDAQIAQHLQEQGVSPLEIQQALEQASIKKAVEETNGEMQPSMMGQEQVEEIPQEYPQYQQYQQPQYQPNTDTFTEMAEQIAEEKINVLRKNLGNFEEIKVELSRKVADIDERLIKIESIINKLQSSILGKVSGYGENIEEIKDEMKMMQDSFSKALNPLVDRTRNKEEQNKEKREEFQQSSKQSKKKANDMEAYLRR